MRVDRPVVLGSTSPAPVRYAASARSHQPRHRPVAVAVPFADVSADGLRWAVGLEAQQALAVTTVELTGPLRAELRILGASHQVVVHAEDRLVFSETVACDLPVSSPLPDRAAVGGYAVDAQVRTHAAADFHDRVTELEATLAEPASLGRALAWARFPGAPDALTAISFVATPAMARWQTWHTYPNTGEVVHTSSTLDLTRVSGP